MIYDITPSHSFALAAGSSYAVMDYRLNGETYGERSIILYATQSESRVGINFNPNESLLTTFEIKSKKNNAEGTELFLRTSRTDKGAEVGDKVGSIYFLVDSGSYNTGSKSQFIQSGSIASIDAKVTNITAAGVQGHLNINVARSNTEADRSLWTMGYGADPRNSGNFGSITTGSLNIVTSPVEEIITFTSANGDYISLSYTSASISTDSLTTLHQFSTNSYSGVIYDYTLINPSNGARTGQVMAVWDGSNVDMTDVSSPTIGTDTPPTLTFDLSGAYARLRITNGNGYIFKSFTKKL